MTPQDQLNYNAAHTKAVPYLVDMLSLWEAMDAASSENGRVPSLLELREEVGTQELRNLCISLHTYVDQVWKSYEAQFGETLLVYDWEFLPLLVSLIHWNTASFGRVPNQHALTVNLPSAPEMARMIHAENAPDIAGRLSDALINDDTEADNTRAVRTYMGADPKTQAAIDDIFISLCGWSLNTLLKSDPPK